MAKSADAGAGLPRPVMIATLAIGVALLGGAGWTAWRQIAFLRVAVPAQAQVVEMRRDGKHVHPVFEFRLPEGRVHRAVGPIGSTEPCCQVGDIVRIRFDPADPRRVARQGFADGWLLPTVLGGFGGIWTAAWGLAAWLTYQSRRARRGEGATARPSDAAGAKAAQLDGSERGLGIVGAIALIVVAVLFGFGAGAAGGGQVLAATCLFGFGLLLFLGVAGVVYQTRVRMRLAQAARRGEGLMLPLAGLLREETPDGPRWVVQARWTGPNGAQHLLQGVPLPFDPVPQMRAMTEVRVNFHRGRPGGLYWMDLSFLKAPE